MAETKIVQLSRKSVELLQENRLKYLELVELIEDGAADTPEVSQELARLLVLERAAELPPSFDTDVCGAILAHFRAASKYDSSLWKQEIKQNRGSKPARARKNEHAIRADYYDLYESVLGSLKVDIFSGELVFKDSDGFWQPASNRLGTLRSEAAAIEESGGKAYSRPLIEDHLETYKATKTPGLCVDIPAWDGQDRIRRMCECLVIADNRSGLNNGVAYDLVRAFFVKMFARLDNPQIQNPVLTLQGPRNLGKDTWLGTLVDGLGQYARQLTAGGQERDLYLQLHRGLVNKIPEFDKLAKWEESKLKDLIFRTDTDMRSAYARSEAFRRCYCSFVASFNPKIATVLRDPALARRFCIFPVTAIVWDYERGAVAEAQVLAQGRALLEAGFSPSDESLSVMREFLDSERSEMMQELIHDYWWELMGKHINSLPLDRQIDVERTGKLRTSDVENHLKSMMSFCGLRAHALNAELRAAGLKGRDMHGVWFAAPQKTT